MSREDTVVDIVARFASDCYMRPGPNSAIYKYASPPLRGGDLGFFGFSVPNRSVLLDVQEQQGRIAFWYYITDVTETHLFEKAFTVCGTGLGFDKRATGHVLQHVATIQSRELPGLVLHVMQFDHWLPPTTKLPPGAHRIGE